MEPQQEPQTDQESNGKNKTGSLVCRQTSARWSPTADQIRILKELYYNGGVRSPTADQIQKISARLRQYGKIEGKNVFYWFQNHKARERQKMRFSTNTTTTSSLEHHHHHHVIPMQRASIGNNSQDNLFHSKYPNLSKGYYHASSGSECVNTAAKNGQMESYGYGSVTMEKHFRDCSISPIGSNGGYNTGGTMNPNLTGWVTMDHNYYNFLDKPNALAVVEGQEDEVKEVYLDTTRTLPLFPMHGEDQTNDGGFWKPNRSNGGQGSSYASLELSLNSYTSVAPD